MNKLAVGAGAFGLGVLTGAYVSNELLSRIPWWLKPPRRIDNEPVSVIIPTYNEEGYIERTLVSVRNQTCSNIEVIVVDYSSDRTPLIAKSYSRVVRVDRPGIAYARNLGVSFASSDILLHLDADTILGHEVVEHLLSSLKDCSHASPALYDGNFIVKAVWTFWRVFKPYWYTQRVIMVRREVFDFIGGFNEDLDRRLEYGKPPLEDKDFGLRVSSQFHVSCLRFEKAATSSRRIKRAGITQRGAWLAYRDGAYSYIGGLNEQET